MEANRISGGFSGRELRTKRLSKNKIYVDDIPEVDEEEELVRESKKRSEMRRQSCQVLTSSQEAINSQESTKGLKNEEIADIYKREIDLNQKNKINLKNAFHMKLIDNLGWLCGTGSQAENFYMAGTALDTGAKIYSARVDHVYQNAHKIVGGLGRKVKEGGEQSENEDDSQLGEAGTSRKTKKRKHPKDKRTVDYDCKNINLEENDIEYEFDPIYRKTCAVGGEGSVEGLLLNQIQLSKDGGHIILQNQSVPAQVPAIPPSSQITNSQLEEKERAKMKNLFAKMAWICCLFEINSKDGIYSDCPTIQDYRFLGWDPKKLSTFGLGEFQPLASSSQRQDVSVDEYEAVLQKNAGSFTIQNDISMDSELNCSQQSIAESSSQMGVVEDQDMLQGTEIRPSTSKQPRKSRHRFLSLVKQDYSYFDAKRLQSWKGPEHWRHAKGLTTRRILGAKAAPTTRKKKNPAQTKIDFFEYEDRVMDRLFRTKLKRPERDSKAVKEEIPLKLVATPLAPEFIRKFFVKNALIPDEVALGDGEQEEDYEGVGRPVEDRSNEKSVHYCPADVSHQWGEMDDDGVSDRSNQSDMFAMGETEREHLTPLPEEEQTSTEQVEALATQPEAEDKWNFNLINEPNRVRKLNIDYSKMQKQVNARLVKKCMWKTIEKTTKKNTENAIKECNEESKENKPEPEASTDFQTLLKTLPKSLPSNQIKDLTTPIALVAFLHLCNEKNLRLEQKDEGNFNIIKAVSQNET